MKVLRIFSLFLVIALLIGVNNCQMGENVSPKNDFNEKSLALPADPDLAFFSGGGHNFIVREALEDSISGDCGDYIAGKALEWCEKNESVPSDTSSEFRWNRIAVFIGTCKDTTAEKILEKSLAEFNLPLDSLPGDWESAITGFAEAADQGPVAVHAFINNFRTNDEILGNTLLAGEAVYDSSAAYWNDHGVPCLPPIVAADLIGFLYGAGSEAWEEYCGGDDWSWWDIVYQGLRLGAGASLFKCL